MDRVAHPLTAALVAVVDEVVAAVTAASGAGVLSQRDALELLLTVSRQTSRLSVAGARLSTAVDHDGLWAMEGARSFAHWWAARGGMPYAKARDLVRMGRALRDHLPATAAAGLAGEISAEQTSTMVKVAATSDVRCQALAAPAEECGEEFLVEHARAESADGFRNLAKRWAAAADPQADERGYVEACEREFVELSATSGGYHLAGFLTTEHGALFHTALNAVTTPPAPGEARSTQQRRAQAVGDLSKLVLEHGLLGTGAAVRPHLAVVVDFDTLRRAVERPRAASQPSGEGPTSRPSGEGSPFFRSVDDERAGCLFRLAPVADVERFAVAEILGAGPIPPSVLARLACDSEISRVVFGPDSRVINVGRAERTYAGPRRKAVIARDGTCRYPGCTAPPALGEIHHINEWAKGHGDTDVNTGILLCWHHHDLVHRLHLQIRPSPTGGWLFLTRHGTPVTTAA